MNLDDTLTLEQLSVSFSTDDGILPAVHAVSLSLPPAGITCLVGESGCGKSLTARAILHLLPENAHISGRILFRGRDLRTMPPEEMRALRGRHIAMIFQEPMTSLNPVLKVGPCACIWACPAARRGRRSSACSPRWASRRRRAAMTIIPISFPAACASA